MRGWRTPNTKFLILRDKDSGKDYPMQTCADESQYQKPASKIIS